MGIYIKLATVINEAILALNADETNKLLKIVPQKNILKINCPLFGEVYEKRHNRVNGIKLISIPINPHSPKSFSFSI